MDIAIKTGECMRWLGMTAVLLLVAALPAVALPPPGWSVGVNTGTTSNLFNDSLGISDRSTGVSVGIDQVLSPHLYVSYNGYGELFADNRDLSSLQHNLNLEAGSYIGSHAEVWTSLRGFSLAYGSEYTVYNRLGYGGEVGGNWVASDVARIRSSVSYDMLRYPNADTLAVDFDDLQGNVGINLATNWRLAADVEVGIQKRIYHQLDPSASTSFFWTTLRLSRPLGPATGAAVSVTLRNQLGVGNDALVALYEGGLDPGDLLWDGWRTGAELNHLAGLWRLTTGAQLGKASYVETQALTGRAPRSDTTIRFLLAGQRTIRTSVNAPAVAVGFSLTWTDNSSTESYFTYNGWDAKLMLSLMSL